MNQIQTGLDFNFTYGVGVTDEQILGVELAGEMWANSIGNNSQHDLDTIINIHIDIDHGSEVLPQDVIGGAYPAVREYGYEEISDALLQDATTTVDSLAVDNLLPGNTVRALVNDNILASDTLKLTTANLKSLDLIDPYSDQDLDAYILLSDLSDYSSVDWNYDYLGGAKPETLDFLSTVTHEIGHTLGFISGTDRIALDLDLLSLDRLALDKVDLKQLAGNMTTLDLFRYSQQSSILGLNDLTIGGDSYFSLDGLQTGLAMSNAQDFQGSHWLDGRLETASGLGIMNPTVALNERWSISENDVMALDAIGWDTNYKPLDMQKLYEQAAANVENAWRGDRTNDINQILDTDSKVYEARRARSSYATRGEKSEYEYAHKGFHSTFSLPMETLIQNSSPEVVLSIHNWIVLNNSNWQAIQFDSFEVAEAIVNTFMLQEYDVAQVIMHTLTLNDAAESTIVDEIVNNFAQEEGESENS